MPHLLGTQAGCTNDFTSEADFNPGTQYSDYPPYLCNPHDLSGYESMGSSIMMEMLLTQYQNSPNLIEFIKAFVEEMDLLLEEAKKVKLGRFIQNATGAQLDVIGIILQQNRNLYVPTIWFGFVGASPIDGMADEATPALGGVFRDGQTEDVALVPLDDPSYRNVLLCRAYCLNQPVFSIDVIYEAINILLGQTPNYMRFIETQHKIWTLELNSNTMTTHQRDLILATKH